MPQKPVINVKTVVEYEGKGRMNRISIIHAVHNYNLLPSNTEKKLVIINSTVKVCMFLNNSIVID